MLNIFGMSLAFIGTIVTFISLILSKPNKEGTSWNELQNISPNQYKNRGISIWGIVLMTIGFLLQLYVAIKAL